MKHPSSSQRSPLTHRPLVRSTLLIFLGAIAACELQSHQAEDLADFHPGLMGPMPAGALGLPFGESVVVQGKVIDGPYKGESSSTEGRLLVQRINGIATQQKVVIRFNPITSREWWHELDRSHADETWKAQEKKLKTMKGKTFEMRGYEQGAHQGMTEEESIIQLSVQSKSFGFSLSFQPLMMKTIPDVQFTPADFINRVAEFEGRAETRNGTGWLIGSNDLALEVRQTSWPTDFEKREVSAKGRVVKSATGNWQMEGADIRLLHLADQLGKEVTLDGLARSSNSRWWFEYRGEKIYVENQKNLPGWNDDLHGSVVTIRGILDRATLPSLDQSSLKPDRDLREYYIVKRASWSTPDRTWKKLPEIPKAPKLTTDYLKSCGIKLDPSLQADFDAWSNHPDR